MVTGWGSLQYWGSSPDQLQEVAVSVIANDECNELYSGGITVNMLCAGETGKDSCQGDSGGPLVTSVEGRYHLIGVVSWGYGCGYNGFPGVYARVTKVLDWMSEITSTGQTCYP